MPYSPWFPDPGSLSSWSKGLFLSLKSLFLSIPFTLSNVFSLHNLPLPTKSDKILIPLKTTLNNLSYEDFKSSSPLLSSVHTFLLSFGPYVTLISGSDINHLAP